MLGSNLKKMQFSKCTNIWNWIQNAEAYVDIWDWECKTNLMILDIGLMVLIKIKLGHVQSFGIVFCLFKELSNLNTITHIWLTNHSSRFLISFMSYLVLFQDTDGKLSKVWRIKVIKYTQILSNKLKGIQHFKNLKKILSTKVWWKDT